MLVAISDASDASSGLLECAFISEVPGVTKTKEGEVGSAVGSVSGDEGA